MRYRRFLCSSGSRDDMWLISRLMDLEPSIFSMKNPAMGMSIRCPSSRHYKIKSVDSSSLATCFTCLLTFPSILPMKK